MEVKLTLEYLGTWEQIYNPNFKVVEFEHFKKQAGLPLFTLSVSDWVESTDAIGMYVKKGKYGGTYIVRNRKVMFDFDLAEIYGYETKNFNRQVKNNIKKFLGEDFMFELTDEEVEELSRCINFTLKDERLHCF